MNNLSEEMKKDIQDDLIKLVSLCSVENNKSLITFNKEHIKYLFTIEDLVHDIIKSKDDIFYLTYSSDNERTICCEDESIFNRIKSLYYTNSFFIDNIFRIMPIHSFNPYIELFIRNLQNKLMDVVEIDINKSYPTNIRYDGFLNDVVDLFNGFIKSIKDEVASKPFKKKMSDYFRLSIENYKSLLDYIDGLFKQHSRLLVLRVDLHYHQNTNIPFMQKEEIYKEYCQVKADRKHFFANMRSNKLFKNMFGYVWKLEYADQKGFHYHMLFFYDGVKVKHDIYYAKRIGEYWKNTITNGRGLYFNCNAKKKDYKYLGIGMIDRRNTDLRENLENRVAWYLIKTDYYAKVVALDEDGKKGRTFGKGEIKLKSNKGKPRNPMPLEMGLNPYS